MGEQNSITGYTVIRHNQIWVDGTLLFEQPGLKPAEFFMAAYEYLQIPYPRFFKMDNLCKVSFLAVEYLLKNKNWGEKYTAEKTGIIFSNANSSLDTDIRFHESMAEAASPALFVYTLPNIAIGEICIRHRIKGESACFVFDIFDFAFQADYINELADTGRIDACIGGWADFYDDRFEAFFYLVEKTTDSKYLIHNKINTGKIYKDTWTHLQQP
jgi:hypothetical protein